MPCFSISSDSITSPSPVNWIAWSKVSELIPDVS